MHLRIWLPPIGARPALNVGDDNQESPALAAEPAANRTDNGPVRGE